MAIIENERLAKEAIRGQGQDPIRVRDRVRVRLRVRVRVTAGVDPSSLSVIAIGKVPQSQLQP